MMWTISPISILRKIRSFFTQSTMAHVHQCPASSTVELVFLMDRFLDGDMRYPLEWDDFISWESDNPHVEQVRNRLGELEPLLFSKNKQQIEEYGRKVAQERDALASLIGIPLRTSE